jgi:hypothetical protein
MSEPAPRMGFKEEKDIRHIVSVTLSETEELPIPTERFSRTVTIRTALGDELVLRLSSESRLALLIALQSTRYKLGQDVPAMHAVPPPTTKL